MTAATRSLLDALHAARVDVWLVEGRLKLRGPAAAVQRLLPKVRQRRNDLLALLGPAPPIAGEAPAPTTTRTCRDCANRTRSGSCAEPVRAGLARRFSIVWPAPAHAARCAAYEARGAANGDGPRSTPGIGAAAPASAYWPPASEQELQRMAGRIERAVTMGARLDEAEGIADRLHLADREGDTRRLCIECAHLRATSEGWRCASARGPRGPLARDLVLRVLHRCAGFHGA
ncbi:hypothetical protein [Caldimonas thermodepolymerans]|jgi:hypothetical protein|uniref:hypothetical protein n=1 Tax=Caldimonas thermodepolymerans TaxID=215580 RepID=UPI0024927D31|nr:hypothetical protein [Caldimonas thermodepolymerans]